MRSFVVILALVGVLFPRPSVAGCPQLLLAAIGEQHSGRAVWINDLAFLAGILPRNTPFSYPKTDAIDEELVRLLPDRWHEAFFIQFVDETGRVLGSKFVTGTVGEVPTEDVKNAVNGIISDLRRDPAVPATVTLVQTRHNHILIPGWYNDFSMADHRLHLGFKAVLEEFGFVNAALEAQVIYADPDWNPVKKSYTLAANLRWRNNDYSPGRRLRHHLLNL